MDEPVKSWADILSLSYENDDPSLRSYYRGDSRTTHWRQKAQFEKFEAVVRSCHKVDEFFKPRSDVIEELDTVENLQEGPDDDERVPKQEHQENEQNDGSQQRWDQDAEWEDVKEEGYVNDEKKNEEDEDKTAKDRKIEEDLSGEPGKELLEKLKVYLKKLSRMPEQHRERIYAVKLYLHGIQDYDDVWLRTLIAQLHGKGRYFADNIKKWALKFKNDSTIPRSKTGCHSKLKSILSHEPIRRELENWLSSDAKTKVTPETFFNKANTVLEPYNITISLSTARNWLLKELGWVRSRRKQGLYKDGHEREDVVQYRKEFVEKMKDIERRRIKHKDDRPHLEEGEKPLIFYTHDEATFQSNDGTRYVYHPANEAPFFKKGGGATFMVSDFISEVDGPITDVREIIQVGKAHDGFWNGEKLANQLNKLVKYHKERYPEYEALVAFDNACIHSCFAANAPRANKMAVNDGSKSQYRAEGMWYMKNGNLEPQSYVFKDKKNPEVEVTKGISRILSERGIRSKPKLGKCRKGCPDRPQDSKKPFCCQMQMLSHQPDFKQQTTMVDDITRKNPEFKVYYYPKFHPELNFIEMYWGRVKRETRASCNYSSVGFKKRLIKALNSVTIETIRAYAGKAFRYMQHYREGLTSLQAEWSMKLYTSHRRLTEREEKKKLKGEGPEDKRSSRWLYERLERLDIADSNTLKEDEGVAEGLDGVTEGGHLPVIEESTAEDGIPVRKTGKLTAYFISRDSGVSTKQEVTADGLGCLDQAVRLPADEADSNDGTPVEAPAPERESTCLIQDSHTTVRKSGILTEYFVRKSNCVPEENKAIAGSDSVVQDHRMRVGKTVTLTAYFAKKNAFLSMEEEEEQELDGGDDDDVYTEEEEEEEEEREWNGSEAWMGEEDEDQVQDEQGEQDDSDVSTEDEEEWEVETITGYEMRRGIPMWLVKWKGYPESESTWEPIENLQNALEAVAEFDAKR